MTGPLTKRAWDQRLYSVNVGPALRDNDSIREILSLEEVESTDLDIKDIRFSAAVIEFTVHGGTPGQQYRILIRFAVEGSYPSQPRQEVEVAIPLQVLRQTTPWLPRQIIMPISLEYRVVHSDPI